MQHSVPFLVRNEKFSDRSEDLLSNRALHSSAVLRSLTLLPKVLGAPQHVYGEPRFCFIFISDFLAPLSSLREYGRQSVPDPCREEIPTRQTALRGRGEASQPRLRFLDSWIPGPDPDPRRAERLFFLMSRCHHRQLSRPRTELYSSIPRHGRCRARLA